MKTLAVTGGIGSGKSTVCAILSGRGIPVYDTDSAAKRLYAQDTSILDEIEEAFGCSIRFHDGSLDRGKLASMAFSDSGKLRLLESIVHPAVLKDFLRWRAAVESRFEGVGESAAFFGCRPFLVIESAIILEKKEFMAHVDRVLLVDAPLGTRLRRACERDGADPSAVIRRMSAQKFDLAKVDAIIRNDGTPDDLEAALQKAFLILKES